MSVFSALLSRFAFADTVTTAARARRFGSGSDFAS